MLIEFHGPPTARLLPPGARLTGASGFRMSAASAAAETVKEEHQSFRRAAASITLKEHYAFHHVRAYFCALQPEGMRRMRVLHCLVFMPMMNSGALNGRSKPITCHAHGIGHAGIPD